MRTSTVPRVLKCLAWLLVVSSLAAACSSSSAGARGTGGAAGMAAGGTGGAGASGGSGGGATLAMGGAGGGATLGFGGSVVGGAGGADAADAATPATGGGGGKGTGGVGSGGAGGQGLDASSADGSAQVDTAATDASGIECPAGLPTDVPSQFCVGNALYEALPECHDASDCVLVPGKFLYCDDRCVPNTNDPGGACSVGGIVVCPQRGSTRPNQICFMNAVQSVGVACSATGGCNCRLSQQERCKSHCVETSEGTAHCE